MNQQTDSVNRCKGNDEALMKLSKPFVKRRKLRKNDLLLRAGIVCNKIMFIRKGACYMYQFENGKKQVAQFYFEGEMPSDLDSFINQQPSKQFLCALEDMEIDEVTHADVQYLYQTSTEFNRVIRIWMEQRFSKAMNRLLSYQNDSAKIRCQKLLKQCPEFFRRVPQCLITSYLGVTPVGLRKIHKLIELGEQQSLVAFLT
jgi:CRP-like cAMP-binding protein